MAAELKSNAEFAAMIAALDQGLERGRAVALAEGRVPLDWPARQRGPEPAPRRLAVPPEVVSAAGRLLAATHALQDEIDPDLEPQAEIAARSLLRICAELWLEVRP